MAIPDQIITPKGTFISSSTPHIANHYLQASIRGAQRLGLTAQSLFDAANIPIKLLNQPSQCVTEQQLTRLIQAIWDATEDEFLGLSVVESNQGVFALMTKYCLGAKTLGSMLKRSAQFYSAVNHAIDIEFQLANNDQPLAFFKIQLLDSKLDQDHLLQEFLLLMWQRLACWMVDQQIRIALTTLSYAAPQHVKEYRAMFGAELKFEQPCCGFYIDQRFLSLPLVKNNAQLNQFLKQAPAFILHRPNQDHRLQTTVKQLLVNQDYIDMPELTSIADQLNLTPRSVSRKLKQEGTSFSAITASLRQDLACKLLTQEHLSISQISNLVGFSETGAFSRAFKRWTGISPAAWR